METRTRAVDRWAAFGAMLLALSPACELLNQRRVTLTSADGTRSLSYRCRGFDRQAKSPEDITVIAENVGRTVNEMVAAHDLAGAASIAQATGDPVRLEQLVVEWRCAHPDTGKPAGR